MPTYEYICQDCGKPFDVRASMSAYAEGLEPACPECGSKATERRFSSVNVMRGSGRSQGSASACDASGFT